MTPRAADPLKPSSPSLPRSAWAGWLLPVLVLLAGGALSAWTYTLVRTDAVRRNEEFFGERISEAQAAITVRMTHYIDALHGGASFYLSAKSMDRAQWRSYAESLQLRKRYPGINGLGVILVVRPDEIEE